MGAPNFLSRLLADTCELCGATERCEVHHIRKLADINKPGRKDKPKWMMHMLAHLALSCYSGKMVAMAKRTANLLVRPVKIN